MKKYPNLRELAEQAGVNIKTLRARLDYGMDLEQALQNKDLRCGNGQGNKAKYTWNGLKGAAQIAKHFGVTPATVFKYIGRHKGDVDAAMQDMVQAQVEHKARMQRAKERKAKSGRGKGMRFNDCRQSEPASVPEVAGNPHSKVLNQVFGG